MIRAGQTIENPITGERLVFHETALQTGGRYSRFEAFVAPGGHLPTSHVHPKQTETFEIISGTLTMKLDGRTFEAGPGETVVVEPGMHHDFANRTGDVVHFEVEVKPALKIESLIETMYGLAADGKTNRWGIPNPLRMAVIAASHFDTVRLAFPPALVQRAALAVGAPIGRLLGYRPEYETVTRTVTAAREAELALSA
jgi:mannose-6-phosphate isomerase-like protein (cupin superfamily)